MDNAAAIRVPCLLIHRNGASYSGDGLGGVEWSGLAWLGSARVGWVGSGRFKS